MTSVSGTLCGTGDLHVASSLTVSQCQKMSQRQLCVGRNQTGCNAAHSVGSAGPSWIPRDRGCLQRPRKFLWDPPWEGHRHVPQQDSHLKHQARHRVLHISFRSICFNSFQVTGFHNARLSALKGEANPVSMVTTRSWNNFEYMFSKAVTKILSLEG